MAERSGKRAMLATPVSSRRASPVVTSSAFIGVLEDITYEPGTGVISRTFKSGKVKPAGRPNGDGYLVVWIGRQRYLAHRLAWFLSYGEWPEQPIDHLNGVRDDNRLSNLRLCDASLNNQNRSAPQRDNKTSKFIGVSGWRSYPGKFRAQIKVSGKKIHLGVFDTEEAAAQAYIKAKRELHPGFVEERFL